MKRTPFSIAAIAMLAVAMPSIGGEPIDITSDNNPSAFNHFINRGALADAWTSLDASGMADGALQTLEAERVLGRPEPNLPAHSLYTLTMRLAMEKNDTESLDRLEKAATQANRTELVAALTIAKKTAGMSRDGKDTIPVVPGDMDVAKFAVYKAYQHDIQAARLCGDARALARISSELEEEGDLIFSSSLRVGLMEQVEVAAAEADSASELPSALNRLVAESRGKIQFQGIYTHYDSSLQSGEVSHLYSPPPQQRRPAATGPALGQQRAGQSTNGQMSYEARQAALQLLRSPNGFKPSFAKPTPNQRRP